MKRNVFFFSLAISSILFFTSCEKENDRANNVKGKVTFEFSLSEAQTQTIALKSTAPDDSVASIVISISDMNGNMVYELEEIELYNMNGKYISKPISLLPGFYSLEQFMVLNHNAEVIYVAPYTGSDKAKFVDNPLPLPITVTKDVVTKIIPDVLAVGNSVPEDFGYSTFSFNVINTLDFLIGVLVYNDSLENFELTSAQLSVSSNGIIITNQELEAITNNVTIIGNYDEYLVKVQKPNYNTFVDTFSFAELRQYYSISDNGPLVIVLDNGNSPLKSVTFNTNQTTLSTINISIWNDNQTPILINWGDGTQYTTSITENSMNSYTHDYQIQGNYQITLSCFINTVRQINIPNNKLTSINLSNAVNLGALDCSNNELISIDLSKNLSLGNLSLISNSINVLDISKNTALTGAYLHYNQISQIDISKNLNIEYLGLNFNNLQSIDVSDNINLLGYLLLATKLYLCVHGVSERPNGI